MAGPLMVSGVFVLLAIALCIFKPQAGRIFMGVFFFLMALGVNGYFTFGNPQAYIDYAGGALIPFYRSLAVSMVSLSPVIFGLLLMAFEIILAILILHKGKAVKVGLLGAILFVVGITPLSVMQFVWLGLVIAAVVLMRNDFTASTWEWMKGKLIRLAQA